MQEKIFFNLYKFLTKKEVFLLRMLMFFALTIILLLFFDDYDILLRIIPIYFLLFLQELFIHYKLEKFLPSKNVNNTQNLYQAMLFDVRVDFEASHTSYEIVKALSLTKKCKFIIEKIDPSVKITPFDVAKEDLLKKSAELVKILNGNHISSLDVVIAYILLQEGSSRILQTFELTEKDLVTILYWGRKRFQVESKKTSKLFFKGQGAFDSLVYGWTPETKNYTSDFTSEVLRLGYEPRIIGREKEYRELVEALSKDSSRNALIVGDTGVGKTTLVMKFGHDAYKGLITKSLKRKRIYFLFVDRLLSGAENKGEVERRIGEVFTEISYSGNIIVFIENIENIFGGGGFDFDISGAIQPYLEGNRVQIVGTTNPQAYKDFIANKPTIQSLFAEINLQQPDMGIAIFMLMEEVDIREKMSKAIVTYGAIKEIVNSAQLYASELSLPGSAVKILDDVIIRNFQAGTSIVNLHDVRQLVNDKTGVNLSAPTQEEKKSLLNMEDSIHKNLIGQNDAVNAVSNALRRLRSGIKKKQGPVSTFLFLGPTGVGKTTTAKLLAKEYYGSEDKMIRVDMSEYQSEDSIKKLLGEMPGEESFSDSLADKISENPFSLVLLDEFEKANLKLLDVFLQILDEGFVTNNKGKKISFVNSIIIATSNAGSEFIRQRNESPDPNLKPELIEHILTKGIFKPELVNRFDEVVVFQPLSKEQISKITLLRISDLQEKLKEQYLNISFSYRAIDKIAEESFDADFGARNVRRYIEDNIENLISRMILEEKIKKGQAFLVDIDMNNNFTLQQ